MLGATFTLLPLGAYFILYPLMVRGGMPPPGAELPRWGDAPWAAAADAWRVFFVAFLLNDWGFYLTHRALHHPALYRRFHKQHHRFTGTVSFAAEYAHPVEVLLSNHMPTLAGCVLMGAHPLVLFVWLVARLEKTYETHSGYSFDGTVMQKLGLANGRGAIWHDFHHSHNQGNFGNMYIDWLCGTMGPWSENGGWEAYARKGGDGRLSYLRPHRA